MKALKKNELDEKEIISDDNVEQISEDKEVDSIDETEASEDISDDGASDLPVEADQADDIEKISQKEEISEGEQPNGELERLRTENRELRAELERAKRLEAELSDFAEIFPEQNIRAIPDEVWQDVKKGNSLSAAFALYEKKRMNLEARADKINQLNAYRSSGQAGSNTAREYFSPDEVRAMSQSEVRANYQRIIESMKKWN